MAKAFAAPSTALVELRGLKSEVYSLRRDKANAELREAEARRQLADLTTWVSTHACFLQNRRLSQMQFSCCFCVDVVRKAWQHKGICSNATVYQCVRGSHLARVREHM